MASRRSDGAMRKQSALPEMKRGLSTRLSVQIRPDPVVKPGQSEAMRVTRKAMPYVAICVFFLTFVVFMWVLPCNWGGCPSMCSQARIKAWEKVLGGLELKGSVINAPGLGTRSRNLVFLVRCRVFLDELKKEEDEEEEWSRYCTPDTDGGLLSLAGSSGDVTWWRPLHGLPREINCSLIDVDENGVADCIVVGDKGLLEAIDPVTGSLRWHIYSVNSMLLPVDLDFPVILPDLDGDGVLDLLASCRVTDVSRLVPVPSEHNYLAMVSGRSGRILGRPYRVPTCSIVSALQLLKQLSVSFLCKDESDEESHKTISLQVLYALITNHAVINPNTTGDYKQHVPTSVAGSDPTDYLVNGHRLTLKNRGLCPLCDTSIHITDPENYVVWNYSSPYTHAMRPVALTVSNVSAPNDTSGFILKLWHWINIEDDDGEDENTVSSTPLKSLSTSEEERFVRANQVRTPGKSGRPRVYTSVHQIQERTVLVTFKESGVDSRTVSERNITQLCSHVDNMDMICQPDLAFQEQSLLIADLALMDGDRELVTFFSTYQSSGPDDTSGPWRFRSEVHVVPLESEMLTGAAQ